jgi:Heterokaryon incompatibility protein (HET)
VLINGNELCIGRNLHQFLQRYREASYLSRGNLREDENCWKRHSDREYVLEEERGRASEYIWIDQICIDQNANVERNRQVHWMGQIYRRADYVIAWLGEHPDAEAYLQSMTNKSSANMGLCDPAP